MQTSLVAVFCSVHACKELITCTAAAQSSPSQFNTGTHFECESKIPSRRVLLDFFMLLLC